MIATQPHRVELVRPGLCSLRWLRKAVADLQARDRLARVSVVVPSPYLGLVARRALAAEGCANVRTVVLRQVAERVAGREAAGSREPLTGVLEGAAIRAAVRDRSSGAFARVMHHRSLHDSLGALFRELRHLDDGAAVDQIAARGDVAGAATATFRRFEALTEPYYDVPGLARLAAAVADRGNAPWAEDLGALVLYLPPRLDRAEIHLLGRIGRRVPVVAAFAHLGETAADSMLTDTATALAAALELPPPTPPVAGPEPPAELLLISTPDPAEEVRGVTRRVAADLEDGVPLWRIGVLYGQEEAYGGPVREALDAAKLPWQAAAGRPLASSWAARSLLGLLGLRERRFARDAVLAWLSDRPPTAEPSAGVPVPSIPMSAWDRLSRRAQVHEGPSQWAQRLAALAAVLERGEERAADPRSAQRGEDRPTAAVPDSAYARAIAAAIARLDRDTRGPGDGATWDDFVVWATELHARYVPVAASWPAAERAASAEVEATLSSLRSATVMEPTTTLRTFRNALAAALESRRVPDGRPGTGILVGSIGGALGAAFDRVYVLGMAEGSFPTRPPADPLTSSDGGPDLLARRDRQREADRRALLGALAAADGGRATLSYPRSDGGSRATHPSRWFLGLLSQREGRTVYASELPGLFSPDRPWLVRVASPHEAVTTLAPSRDRGARVPAPADLADLRLKGIVSWHAAGRELARHPLARRAELPLGAALCAAGARRSRAFTAYDGNLGELASSSRLMARAFGVGTSSATAVERWSTCHFRYLLQNLLKVEATQRPEDGWTITALDRGSVVHEVLEAFFHELVAGGRLGVGDAIADADHARIEEIAAEAFARLEAEGRTGHPLAWENVRAAILADLHELVARDQAWRAAEGLVPALFERSFGNPRDPDSWPAATVTLADGTAVSFRGAIDRVDLSPPGVTPRRALIIDYKTGGASAYAGLEDDPLLGGRHVQLAVYARAFRASLPMAADSPEIRAEFRFVSSAGDFARQGVTADDHLDARLDEVVRQVAGGIQTGVFLPIPGARKPSGWDNCRFCDYDRVCSTSRDETWERKHGALGECASPQ